MHKEDLNWGFRYRVDYDPMKNSLLEGVVTYKSDNNARMYRGLVLIPHASVRLV